MTQDRLEASGETEEICVLPRVVLSFVEAPVSADAPPPKASKSANHDIASIGEDIQAAANPLV